METIVIERLFPSHTPPEDLQAACALRLKFGALACWIEDRGDQLALVSIRRGPGMADDPASTAPAPGPEALAVAASVEAVQRAPTSVALGELSKRYESNGDPAAIGEDSTGGPSYGTYQIATKTGTMVSFLKFLERSAPHFAGPLEVAGGAVGAGSRSPAFEAAWRALAADPAFATAQHAFIKLTHYDPFVDQLKETLGLDVEARSNALCNVAWSTAVQHGPRNRVFLNALGSKERASALTDQQVIEAVYDERSKVDRYFKSSTPTVQAAVLKRFTKERADALTMIG